MSVATRRLVDSLTRRAVRQARSEANQHRAFRAIVTATKNGGTDVRAAEMLHAEIELEDEDIVLGQWAKRYGHQFGFETGDLIVLQPLEDDDFMVIDVQSTTDVS